MLWTGELNRVLEPTQIVPSGDDVHRMAHHLVDPGGHLTGRPAPAIIRWVLQSQVQRLTLDLIEQ